VQLDWLQLQPRQQFFSQPFEQLATAYRNMGLEDEVRKVMIAKNSEHAQWVKGQPEWLWYGIFGPWINFGYTPWVAFQFSLTVVGFGSFIFWRGDRKGLIAPTSEGAYGTGRAHQLLESYPKFSPIIYSVETFVPFLKLGIGDYWMPNAKRGKKLILGMMTTGGALRLYYWLHITAGWVLSALWIGGLTGIVKT
jgi:hypothetical protein